MSIIFAVTTEDVGISILSRMQGSLMDMRAREVLIVVKFKFRVRPKHFLRLGVVSMKGM